MIAFKADCLSSSICQKCPKNGAWRPGSWQTLWQGTPGAGKLYCGKEEDNVDKGLAHRVLETYRWWEVEGEEECCLTDNFYSSPALFRDLLVEGFGACGTVRKDRRGVPSSVKMALLKRWPALSKTASFRKDKRDSWTCTITTTWWQRHESHRGWQVARRKSSNHKWWRITTAVWTRVSVNNLWTNFLIICDHVWQNQAYI